MRRQTLIASLALGLAGNACSAPQSRQPPRVSPVCTPQPELPDELDLRTGLAPVPRHADGDDSRPGGDDSRPSGPQYWRQMRPVPIPGVGRAVKVVVAHETACAELHDGGTTCWTLPYDRFQHVPLGREPENLVKTLSKSGSLAAPTPRPDTSPDVAQAFVPFSHVAQVEVGLSLACARFENGEVQCLSTAPPERAPSASDFPTTPAPIPGLSARALSVGGAACAITGTDEVVCWGFIAQAALFPACEASE